MRLDCSTLEQEQSVLGGELLDREERTAAVCSHRPQPNLTTVVGCAIVDLDPLAVVVQVNPTPAIRAVHLDLEPNDVHVR